MQYSVTKSSNVSVLRRLSVTKDVTRIQSNWYQKVPVCCFLKTTIITTILKTTKMKGVFLSLKKKSKKNGIFTVVCL